MREPPEPKPAAEKVKALGDEIGIVRVRGRYDSLDFSHRRSGTTSSASIKRIHSVRKSSVSSDDWRFWVLRGNRTGRLPSMPRRDRGLLRASRVRRRLVRPAPGLRGTSGGLPLRRRGDQSGDGQRVLVQWDGLLKPEIWEAVRGRRPCWGVDYRRRLSTRERLS